MASYLWTGKDNSGNDQTERIEAATAEEAKNILISRGWTDLRLLKNEIHEFVQQEIDAVSAPEFRPELSPEEEAAYIEGTAPGFWSNWWKTARESGTTFLILGVWFAWSVYRQKIWSIAISGGILLGIAFLFPVLHFWFGRTGEMFRRLHEARNWRRWNEVLSCLEGLDKLQASRRMGIGAAETARYRALALAGLGKTEEAIKVFTDAAEQANMPRWLYFSHLSGIHTVSARYDAALDCFREAFAQAPDKGIVAIDYASYLVQRFNRPAEARQFLAIAEASILPDLATAHLSALKGVIGVREGDFVAAKKFMLEALANFQGRAKNQSFAFEPSLLLTHGYLALICAALGEKEEARRHFSQSQKYLRTIKMDELIAEYQSRMR